MRSLLLRIRPLLWALAVAPGSLLAGDPLLESLPSWLDPAAYAIDHLQLQPVKRVTVRGEIQAFYYACGL